jgi:BirA family transcriptional regulator, biotin operon repressor / biotin---[acetyl-CoA-carboxylase] ligase
MVIEMTDTDHPERPPLDGVALTKQVVRPDGLWREVLVVERTGSTNTDCAARARAGAPEGLVLAAEEQTAGRGRLCRTWLSPPRAALTFSVLLRPAGVPPARRGWLPLLAGVATATAVRHVSGLDARLKWPNDLLLGPGKLAGILAEQSGDAVIVGIGVNVSAARAELPVTAAAVLPAAVLPAAVLPAAVLPAAVLPATSLLLEGSASLDRERLLREILAEIERWYRAWRGTEIPGDPQASGLRAAYLGLCSTVGRDVQAELSAGNIIRGTAAGIDADGRLIVRTPEGEVAVGAGDVRHIR